jgi:hypothetical protein
MKAFDNMTTEERRPERMRRLAVMVKAIRGLDRDEAFGLLAAAFVVDGERRNAAIALKAREVTP